MMDADRREYLGRVVRAAWAYWTRMWDLCSLSIVHVVIGEREMTRRATDPAILARTITQASPRQMSEAELLRCVIELAGYLGWKHYHTWTSIHSAAGFPDLVLLSVRQRRVIWAELKGARGRLSDAQHEWLTDLREAGCEAVVWYPVDWHSGTIERILRGEVTHGDCL